MVFRLLENAFASQKLKSDFYSHPQTNLTPGSHYPGFELMTCDS